MTAKLTRADILALLKIDLHRHLDGATRPELVIKMARDFGIKLPTYDLNEFTKLYQITDKNMSIDDMLQRFAWAIAVMRHPYSLSRIARQQVLDLAEENILYAEIRFAPGYHSIYPAPWYSPAKYEEKEFPVMSLDHTVQTVLSGLQLGMKKTGITVNLVLCIPRESLAMYGRKCVEDVIDVALRFQDRGVVGIDLACDEFTYPPDAYAEFFRSTTGSRLRRTLHAGEMGPQNLRIRNIAAVIEKFSPNGIGHAIPIYLSDYLMGLSRIRNIRIERTPLSPVVGCSLAEGRLDQLLKHRVPVVITSDDPVLMQASLTDNLEAALNYYGYGEKEFWQLTANALDTAFFRDETEERKIRQVFAHELSKSLLVK